MDERARTTNHVKDRVFVCVVIGEQKKSDSLTDASILEMFRQMGWKPMTEAERQVVIDEQDAGKRAS